jgi:hypothetical protein
MLVPNFFVVSRSNFRYGSGKGKEQTYQKDKEKKREGK